MPLKSSSKQSLNGLAWQLVRFGLVGGAATATHLAAAWVTIWLWPDVSPFVANFIAFTLAFQVSFWGHSRFTFVAKGSLARFLIVSGGGLLLNNVLLALLLVPGVFSPFIAICLATAMVPIFVFIASKLWVFRPS